MFRDYFISVLKDCAYILLGFTLAVCIFNSRNVEIRNNNIINEQSTQEIDQRLKDIESSIAGISNQLVVMGVSKEGYPNMFRDSIAFNSIDYIANDGDGGEHD